MQNVFDLFTSNPKKRSNKENNPFMKVSRLRSSGTDSTASTSDTESPLGTPKGQEIPLIVPGSDISQMSISTYGDNEEDSLDDSHYFGSQSLSELTGNTKSKINETITDDDINKKINDAYTLFNDLIRGENSIKNRAEYNKTRRKFIEEKIIDPKSIPDDAMNFLFMICDRRYRREVKKSFGKAKNISELDALESQIFALFDYDATLNEDNRIMLRQIQTIHKSLVSTNLFNENESVVVNTSNVDDATKDLFADIELYASLIDGCHDSENIFFISNEQFSAAFKNTFQNELLLLKSKSFCAKKANKDLLYLCSYIEKKLRENNIAFNEYSTTVIPKAEFKSFTIDDKIQQLFENYNWIQEAGRGFGITVFDTMLSQFDKGTRTLVGLWRKGEQYTIENVYGVNLFIKCGNNINVFDVITSYNTKSDNYTYFIRFQIGTSDAGKFGVSLNDAIGLLQSAGIHKFDHAIRNDTNIDIRHIDMDLLRIIETSEFRRIMNEFKSYPEKTQYEEFSFDTLIEASKEYDNRLPKSPPENILIKLIFSLKGAGDASNGLMFKGNGRVPTWSNSESIENAVTTNDSYLVLLLRLGYLLGNLHIPPMVARQTVDSAIVTNKESTNHLNILRRRLAFIKYVLPLHESQQIDAVKKYYGLNYLESVYRKLDNTTNKTEFESIILMYLKQVYNDKMQYVKNWVRKLGNVDTSLNDAGIIKHEVFENLDYHLSLKELHEILDEYDEYILDQEFAQFNEIIKLYLTTRRGTNVHIIDKINDNILIKLQNNHSVFLKLIDEYNKEVTGEAYLEDNIINIINVSTTQKDEEYISLRPSIELYIKLKNSVAELHVNGTKTEVETYFNEKIYERKRKIMNCHSFQRGGKTRKKPKTTRKRKTRKSSKILKLTRKKRC